MTAPFATSISVDYSDDELDAVASAFLRPDLARRADRAGGSAIQRAQHQTALRGLVARRAIALGGAPGKPRITFLDPHATMFHAFLNAGAVATIRVEERSTARASTLFVSGEAVVHQAALPGQGIQRMTAYGPDAANELLERELGLTTAGQAVGSGDSASGDGAAGDVTAGDVTAGPVRFDVSRAALRAAVSAIDAEKPAPRDVPAGAADVLYARISSGNVAISARSRDGARVAGSWTWIDAGALGFWQLVGMGDAEYVSLQQVDRASLVGEVQAAWDQVVAEAPPG